METALSGVPLDPKVVATDIETAVAAGTNFIGSLPCTSSAGNNPDWYQRSIGEPLRALSSLVPNDAGLHELIERTHQVLAPLMTTPLPAVMEHGDMSHPNLFLKPRGKLQVVDWERASPYGVPGHDLVFYLQYLTESREQAFARQDQLKSFDHAFGKGGWALEPLREHLALRSVDSAILPLLVIATWARSAATLSYRLSSSSGKDQNRVDVNAVIAADRDFWLWRHAVSNWPSRSP
ncbi:hypothetical protein ARTHROSP310_14160 [Arthrobacter sp. AD-310]